MEIMYLVIYLAVSPNVFAFHFGNILQTLPPSLPEHFKKQILDMYSKNPEMFGDPANKASDNVMKMHKHKKRPQILGQLQSTAQPDIVNTQNVSVDTLLLTPMPMMPIPIPVPMYPDVPIIMPMRTYYERVKHYHPPLHEIRKKIKKDEEWWNKHETTRKKKKKFRYSSSFYTDTSESSDDKSSFQYYDDVIKIRGS
ncbi:unnamed protein product [Arctia plantaginis]|uniref:Uncharacterized protein n=1 Tax=Arctia plantaginis TaxID=874455 RepID=A0A8S0Z3D8_ARCPL|nr:unnamed protein product [Arctia plantaginis]